jgi:hypothetical protein
MTNFSEQIDIYHYERGTERDSNGVKQSEGEGGMKKQVRQQGWTEG